MKTSAPVSTLRYHSGASWAALIQHLGSIPKAVQYSVTRCSRRVAGWPRFLFPPTISPRMTMLGRRSSRIILRQIKYAQMMFLHHFVCSVHFPTVQKHTGIETIPHFYWKNGMGVGLQMVFSLFFWRLLLPVVIYENRMGRTHTYLDFSPTSISGRRPQMAC